MRSVPVVKMFHDRQEVRIAAFEISDVLGPDNGLVCLDNLSDHLYTSVYIDNSKTNMLSDGSLRERESERILSAELDYSMLFL